MASYRPFDEYGYNFDESAKKLIEEIKKQTYSENVFLTKNGSVYDINKDKLKSYNPNAKNDNNIDERIGASQFYSKTGKIENDANYIKMLNCLAFENQKTQLSPMDAFHLLIDPSFINKIFSTLGFQKKIENKSINGKNIPLYFYESVNEWSSRKEKCSDLVFSIKNMSGGADGNGDPDLFSIFVKNICTLLSKQNPETDYTVKNIFFNDVNIYSFYNSGYYPEQLEEEYENEGYENDDDKMVIDTNVLKNLFEFEENTPDLHLAEIFKFLKKIDLDGLTNIGEIKKYPFEDCEYYLLDFLDSYSFTILIAYIIDYISQNAENISKLKQQKWYGHLGTDDGGKTNHDKLYKILFRSTSDVKLADKFADIKKKMDFRQNIIVLNTKIVDALNKNKNYNKKCNENVHKSLKDSMENIIKTLISDDAGEPQIYTGCYYDYIQLDIIFSINFTVDNKKDVEDENNPMTMTPKEVLSKFIKRLFNNAPDKKMETGFSANENQLIQKKKKYLDEIEKSKDAVNIEQNTINSMRPESEKYHDAREDGDDDEQTGGQSLNIVKKTINKYIKFGIYKSLLEIKNAGKKNSVFSKDLVKVSKEDFVCAMKKNKAFMLTLVYLLEFFNASLIYLNTFLNLNLPKNQPNNKSTVANTLQPVYTPPYKKEVIFNDFCGLVKNMSNRNFDNLSYSNISTLPGNFKHYVDPMSFFNYARNGSKLIGGIDYIPRAHEHLTKLFSYQEQIIKSLGYKCCNENKLQLLSKLDELKKLEETFSKEHDEYSKKIELVKKSNGYLNPCNMDNALYQQYINDLAKIDTNFCKIEDKTSKILQCIDNINMKTAKILKSS